jgi:hypothetical protein
MYLLEFDFCYKFRLLLYYYLNLFLKNKLFIYKKFRKFFILFLIFPIDKPNFL